VFGEVARAAGGRRSIAQTAGSRSCSRQPIAADVSSAQGRGSVQGQEVFNRVILAWSVKRKRGKIVLS
jgi:hypothetical protein